MKKSVLLCAVLSSLVLSGCQQYTVSEAEVNQRLQTLISKQQGVAPLYGKLAGVSVSYQINDARVDLQSRRGGIVVTKLSGMLMGSSSWPPVQLSMPLAPVIESRLDLRDGQIYLKQLKVRSWGGNIPGLMQPELAALEGMLSRYIEGIPVYTLDHSVKEVVAADLVKRITIDSDNLIFEI